MESKISKAQQRAVTKYVKNNYDRINVTFPKGKRAEIQEAASTVGVSVNTYIREAIETRMKIDLADRSEDVE